jgi:hypothetical protein
MRVVIISREKREENSLSLVADASARVVLSVVFLSLLSLFLLSFVLRLCLVVYLCRLKSIGERETREKKTNERTNRKHINEPKNIREREEEQEQEQEEDQEESIQNQKRREIPREKNTSWPHKKC